MHKVVYNATFGGFSLSKSAVTWLAKKGSEEAIKLLKEQIEEDFFYGYWEGDRHDPLLVSIVETLGQEAGGDGSDLRIQEIKGNTYIIDEYDGRELVLEPSSIKWVVI